MAELTDLANWDGVILKSTDVGGCGRKSKADLIYKGIQYATEGEFLLAQLLHKMKVAFTPNVKFVLRRPPQRTGHTAVIYVPDFIFDKQAFVWRDETTGQEEVIHGLEAKGMNSDFKAKAKEKVALLKTNYGINVKLVGTKQIRAWLAAGTLPMRPL
ncbi:MAG: hypothetical protein WCT10_01750 [Patescibacteria group bacterium]|jgi:hypothetical protein